jgi:DNA-binding MarR family transcriptional regulator
MHHATKWHTGTVPPSPPTPDRPAAEDTFMAVLVAVGSVLRQRLPGDEHDFSLLPVLVELDRCGPVRHSDLADRLRLDASTVSRRVKHLAEQDLVAVTQDTSDARARRVQIRPAGRKALAQLRSRRRDLLGEVMQGWDPRDRDELQRLLARFLDDLGDMTGVGAPSPTHLTHPAKDSTR